MYQIIHSVGERVLQYGILGKGFRLENIETDERQMCEFVEILNRQSVSEVHIFDVLEDWFGTSAYLELKL